MGIVECPSIEDYWANNTWVPQVANVMSSKRFMNIRAMIHFNDNETIHESNDRYYKVRPIFDMLRKEFLKIPHTPKQSIDEVMVGYKGKRAGNLRQYIKSKPDKWGFKIFSRSSIDGIIHDFILYQGKSTFDNHPIEFKTNELSMNLSSRVVIGLCKTMHDPSKSAIYADNFFTSLSLAQYLKSDYGCRYTGTARENRIGKVNLLDSKIMSKSKRGTLDYKSSDGVLILKWKDNKVVTLLSTDVGIEPILTIERYEKEIHGKKDVPCPMVVKTYNSNMGGIDKSDMLVHLYKTPLKARRWYLKLFGYCIDVTIVNSWLVYRRDCEELNIKYISLKKFRLSVSEFMRCQKPTIRRPTRTSMAPAHAFEMPQAVRGQKADMPTENVRLDYTTFHAPQVVKQRLSCKLCSTKDNLRRSQIVCSVCKVSLCLNNTRNCFNMFHTK